MNETLIDKIRALFPDIECREVKGSIVMDVAAELLLQTIGQAC